MGVCMVGVVGWEGGDWVGAVVDDLVGVGGVECVVGLVLRGVDVEVVEGFRAAVARVVGVFPHVVWLGGGVGLGEVLGVAREVVLLSGGRWIVVVVGGGEDALWGFLLSFVLAGAGLGVGVYLVGRGLVVEPGVLGELGVGVSGLDARILRVLAEAPGLDSEGIAERLGLVVKTVSNRVSLLRSRGLVDRVGGGYRVTKRGAAVLFLRGLASLHEALRSGVSLGVEERPYDPRRVDECPGEDCDG